MSFSIAHWGPSPDAPPAAQPELITSARAGDPGAFAALYRQHARRAYTLALRITGQTDQAEDVVQDAFLRALERIGGFRGDAPFGAWLQRLVANVAIDRIRTQRRRPEDDLDLQQLEARQSQPDRPLDALGLLRRLAPDARTVLVLHDMEGYSHGEIAIAFGRSESWSKSLLARTRSRLAAWIESEEQR